MSLKIENEIKIDSDPCVLAWESKLFVGTEDGSIKSFDRSLKQEKSWSAHAVQIFAMTAGNGRVYSTSNDGGIRVWNTDGDKITQLPKTGADFGTLHLYEDELYAGDEDGNVIVFERDSNEKARYNLLEEVKDLAFSPPYLFTVRDLDVTITEIKPHESKYLFTMKHSMEGRAPLCLMGRYLLVVARDGNTLRLHDATPETHFKKMHELKVSDMILTSLSVSGEFVWTGGWDGHVRRFRVTDSDQLEPSGEISLGSCVNSLAAIAPDAAFAALAGGRVVRVSAA